MDAGLLDGKVRLLQTCANARVKGLGGWLVAPAQRDELAVGDLCVERGRRHLELRGAAERRDDHQPVGCFLPGDRAVSDELVHLLNAGEAPDPGVVAHRGGPGHRIAGRNLLK